MANILSIILDATAKPITKAMDKVDKSVKQTEKSVSKFMKKHKVAFLAVGAAVAGATVALVKGTKSAVKYGLELDKLSKTAGMSTEAVSRLAYAMEQEHGNTEALGRMLPILARRMSDAREGLETYTRSFERAGIEVTDAEGNIRSVNEVFLELADYMASGATQTDKMATAQELLGRSGKELIPFLQLGRDTIEALGDEAQRLGVVMGQTDVRAMKVFDDTITAVKFGIKGIWIEIATKLLPYLHAIAEWMKENMGKIRKTVGDVFDWIIGKIPFIAGLIDKIYEAFQNAVLGVKTLGATFLWLYEEWDKIALGILKIAGGILERIGAEIASAISFSLQKIKFFGAKAFDFILSALASFLSKIQDILINAGYESLANITRIAKDSMREIASEVRKTANPVWEQYHDKFIKEHTSMLDEGKALLSKAKGSFMTIMEPIFKAWGDRGEAGFRKLLDVVAKGSLSIKGMVDKIGIKNIIGKTEEVSQIVNEKTEKVKQDLSAIAEKLKTEVPASAEMSTEEIVKFLEKLDLSSFETFEQLKNRLLQYTEASSSFIGRLSENMRVSMTDWIDVAQGAFDRLTSGIGNAFSQMIVHGKSFGGSMKQMWKSLADFVVSEITRMLAKWLVFKALSSIGLGGIFEKGGMVPSLQKGGPVPIIAHAGEYVIPADFVDQIRRTRAVPDELVSAIAGGRSPGRASFQAGGMIGNVSPAVDVGGISISVSQVQGEDVETLLDKIGNAVENNLASGVATAMKIFNKGSERQGDAV